MAENPLVQPAGSGLVTRAKAMLMQPKAEWPRVAAETTEPMKVLTGYAIPLALIGPIASLIGSQIFGINAVIMTLRPTLSMSLATAVTSFVGTIVSLFVIAFVANWLSPKFDGRDNFPAAFRLVAYAMTAAWIGGVFGLIPAIAIIGLLFSIYSLYLFYLGSTPVLGVPADKTFGFTALTVVIAIVVQIVVGLVAASLLATTGFAPGMMGPTELTQGSVDLGEYGNITIDGASQTVDMGELGRIEIDGDTATVTVDGQAIDVRVDGAQSSTAE